MARSAPRRTRRACRCPASASAPIKPKNDAKLADLSGKRVFSERASILFKTIDVRRFYDAERNTLCYVAISTKLINGSPVNATSCIAVNEVM